MSSIYDRARHVEQVDAWALVGTDRFIQFDDFGDNVLRAIRKGSVMYFVCCASDIASVDFIYNYPYADMESLVAFLEFLKLLMLA